MLPTQIPCPFSICGPMNADYLSLQVVQVVFLLDYEKRLTPYSIFPSQLFDDQFGVKVDCQVSNSYWQG